MGPWDAIGWEMAGYDVSRDITEIELNDEANTAGVNSGPGSRKFARVHG